MWEKFMTCFDKGSMANNCYRTLIPDLYKRVPANQRKQFKAFAKLNEEYNIRVRKYPSKMPRIDWDYYRKNVREEMVGWVKEFEKKYDRLDSVFANRHSLIDHSKYFGELEAQTEEVKKEIKKYKEESNERIKMLRAKAEQLERLKPYSEMTMEEFCLAHPNEAPDFINKPTFWPHTPEEQKPGPGEGHAHADESDDPSQPKPDPSKAPPKTPPTGDTPAGGSKPQPPANAKKDNPKDPNEKKPAPPKEAEKAKLAVAKPSTESQAVETASQMAAKGVEFVKDLAAKAVVLLKTIYDKIGEKRKQVAETAKAERLKNESQQKQALLAAKPKPSPDDDDDSFVRREALSNICHKTIIRGEDTAIADVKPQHVNLDIEQKDDRECELKTKCEEDDEKECQGRAKCEEEDDSDCKRKAQCEEEEKEAKCQEEEEEDDCQKDKKKSSDMICCPEDEKKSPYEDACKEDTNPCVFKDSATKPDKKHPTCESSQDMVIGDKFIEQLKGEKINANRVLEIAELAMVGKFSPKMETKSDKDMINLEGKKDTIQGRVDTTNVLSMTQQAITSSDEDTSDKVDTDELAKLVFEMATGAASLLSDAKKTIEKAQLETSRDNVEGFESAYEAAERKVSQALGQAYRALSSARKLTKQASGSEDQNAIALIEKHAMLAKLLAQRAISMKKEIAKLLAGIQKNQ